jgi:hypothetical protein
MPKSMRDIWRDYKSGMGDLKSLVKGTVADAPDLKEKQKRMDAVLKLFDQGFGPELDKFEAAMKKKDKKAIETEQKKCHGIIDDYTIKINHFYEEIGLDRNVIKNCPVKSQLAKFGAEIDKRAKEATH